MQVPPFQGLVPLFNQSLSYQDCGLSTVSDKSIYLLCNKLHFPHASTLKRIRCSYALHDAIALLVGHWFSVADRNRELGTGRTEGLSDTSKHRLCRLYKKVS